MSKIETLENDGGKRVCRLKGSDKMRLYYIYWESGKVGREDSDDTVHPY